MQLRIQAPFRGASLHMNAESYGFERIDGVLVPEIVISKLDSLPGLCKCGKCAQKNVSCPKDSSLNQREHEISAILLKSPLLKLTLKELAIRG